MLGYLNSQHNSPSCSGCITPHTCLQLSKFRKKTYQISFPSFLILMAESEQPQLYFSWIHKALYGPHFHRTIFYLSLLKIANPWKVQTFSQPKLPGNTHWHTYFLWLNTLQYFVYSVWLWPVPSIYPFNMSSVVWFGRYFPISEVEHRASHFKIPSESHPHSNPLFVISFLNSLW